MTARENAYLRHQQARWMRPDAYRWIRPDAARFLNPGTDTANAYPGLECKYRPSQPRVPAGSGRESGQWTDGNGAGASAGGNANVTQPMGNIDLGDLPNVGDLFSLFQITPAETDNSEDTQLAGDIPTGDSPELPSSEPPEIPQERPKPAQNERDICERPPVGWAGMRA